VETRKSGSLILARVDDGEDLFSNLEKIAEKYSLSSGIIICALGMLKNGVSISNLSKGSWQI
jgi:predicted DNA-binding protein with PD1-like motif